MLNGVLRNVRVRVVDSADRPVPGVEMYPIVITKPGKFHFINLGPLPLDPRTDADGVATFDWLPADATEVHLETARSDYRLPASCNLDLSKPDAMLTARVLRPARVSGKVAFPDGSPAPGSGSRPVGPVAPGCRKVM